GPPPDPNADAYLAEEMAGGGTSTYGGGGAGNSPRSVYGGSNFGGSRPVHARSPSSRVAAGSNVGGGSGFLSVVATPGGQHRRGDSNVSVKSGLGLNRTGGGGGGGGAG
ncbi:unnamed protein product, partial [Ectocarpus fasciculatus]